MNSRINTLDVRDDFRTGQHPCDKIHDALSGVAPGETLRLLVPFEPVPLFEVAARNGLGHRSSQTPEGDWEILFSHDPEAANRPEASGPTACDCAGPTSAEAVDVDARGLEPPQPMVRILEALAHLANGAQLRARTDRRPVHLLPVLESRGFTGTSEEQQDGSFLTHIRRA